MTTLADYIEYSTRSPRESTWAVKGKLSKSEIKKLNLLLMFDIRDLWQDIFTEESQDSIKKSLLELTATTITKFTDSSEYKSKCRNQFCFYTLAMKSSKNQIKKIIPFIIEWYEIKYLE